MGRAEDAAVELEEAVGELRMTGSADVDGVRFATDPALLIGWHEREVRVFRRSSKGLSSVLSLRSDLRRVVAATLIEADSFLVVVDAAGAFELYDVASGRLVAFDRTRGDTSATSDRPVPIYTVGDEIEVRLRYETLRIPISTRALTRLVCARYPIDRCPT
jgi:hypothetical protein